MVSILMNHHWTNINGMFTGFPVLEKHVLIDCWCRIEITQQTTLYIQHPTSTFVGGVHNFFWSHSRQILIHSSNVLAWVRKYRHQFFFEFPCGTILRGTSMSLRNRYCMHNCNGKSSTILIWGGRQYHVCVCVCAHCVIESVCLVSLLLCFFMLKYHHVGRQWTWKWYGTMWSMI